MLQVVRCAGKTKDDNSDSGISVPIASVSHPTHARCSWFAAAIASAAVPASTDCTLDTQHCLVDQRCCCAQNRAFSMLKRIARHLSVQDQKSAATADKMLSGPDLRLHCLQAEPSDTAPAFQDKHASCQATAIRVHQNGGTLQMCSLGINERGQCHAKRCCMHA